MIVKELRSSHDIYLVMNYGETIEEAETRLHKIIREVERANSGLVVSQTYDNEIQEYNEED